jgi:cellulose synthase/poly-beta-1,6-N-acetylglucosamine synthase-like glycosyltransferase
VGGFTGIDDVASGDDELLMQKVAAQFPGKIGFLKLRDAIVYTHAKHNLKEFMRQRKRWASKSTKYKDKKFVAFSVSIWLFNVSLIANVLLGLYQPYFMQLFLVQIVLKFSIEIMYLVPITLFFKRISLVFLLIIISPIHCIYIAYIGLAGNSGKYIWKGRLVK